MYDDKTQKKKPEYEPGFESNIQLWISENGSPYFKKVPLFKTEYIYPSKFSVDQIIQAIHSPDLRCKWDRNVESKTLVRKVNRVELIHTVIKPHPLDR